MLRALALLPVYAFIVWAVRAARTPPDIPAALVWGGWLGLALAYGLLVASWWALIAPGTLLAWGVIVVAFSRIEDAPVLLISAVLTLTAAIAIAVGVSGRKAVRRWGKTGRNLG